MKTQQPNWDELFTTWMMEDGQDITTAATIDPHQTGQMKLLAKQSCVIAGIEAIDNLVHSKSWFGTVQMLPKFKDGDIVQKGDVIFILEGKVRILLVVERIILNLMQRMSGIATKTKSYVQKVDGYAVQICDTRKTAPGLRYFDKWAVVIGGGTNHRMGLNDMFMIKDNHSDFTEGIVKAIIKVHDFKMDNPEYRSTPVAVEVRNMTELVNVLSTGCIDRIMLDNFDVENTRIAVDLINRTKNISKVVIESTGGMNYDNVRQYAECGVDFISVGDLTHHVNSVDLSLKFIK